MRRLAEDADRPGLFLPFHHPVVRDVAPNQTAQIAEPHRTFVEAAAGGDPLDRRVAEHHRLKARVDDLDVGVWIADRVRGHAFLPLFSSRDP